MRVPTSDDFYGWNATNLTSSTYYAKIPGCKLLGYMMTYAWIKWCHSQDGASGGFLFLAPNLNNRRDRPRRQGIFYLRKKIESFASTYWTSRVAVLTSRNVDDDGWLLEAGGWRGESDCCCRMSFISKSIKSAVRSSLAGATSSDI